MSQAENLDAINAYMLSTKVVTQRAASLKNSWVVWWNELSWYGKNVDSANYNTARNMRNDFSKANVSSPAELAQVQQVLGEGLTTEQQQGMPDPRDADGVFYVKPPEKPPLIPTEYKVGVIVAGVLFGGLFFYGLSQSLPKALLTRRPAPSPHLDALKTRLGV